MLARFKATTFDELFEKTKAAAWEHFIGKNNAFPVKGWSLKSGLFSVPDCQAIVKKAVVERLKQKYNVSWFDETGPKMQIQFSIMKDEVCLMLDTSGEGLHKRGYREKSKTAPIRETLAAAMVQLSRIYPDSTVIDPFCGSGTILIESALMANNISPGVGRRYAAESYGFIDDAVWKTEKERAKDLVKKSDNFKAIGCDIDETALDLTRKNASLAGVGKYIETNRHDIAKFEKAGERGIIITNPPYGERMLDIHEAQKLYKIMGSVFTPQKGWKYNIISPDDGFEKIFGRTADKRRKLYNGMIKCQLYSYYK